MLQKPLSLPRSLGLTCLVGACCIGGCSTIAPKTELQTPAEAPVEIRVDRAFYQADGLHVKVRVTSKTELPTADIVVNVTGLDEGQVIESYEKRLSEVFPVDDLDAGEAAMLDFVLKRPELSEYQVQCRWGEEAHKPASAAKPDAAAAQSVPPQPPGVENDSARAALTLPETSTPDEGSGVEIPLIAPGGDLSLKVVELEHRVVDCAQPPCDRFYTIRATLLNQSARPIGGIVLASGLQWVNQGATSKEPEPFAKLQEGEESVALDGFVLQPGKEKRLKIAVDRAVPEVPGGSFMPYVRLVASAAAESLQAAPSAAAPNEVSGQE